jgi:hypothetical protein
MLRMFSRRLRPSPSMAVAFVALLVALGGTSYAVVRLPANSVGNKQIKRNAVTAGKIRANSVTSARVLNNSLTGDDIQESSLGKVASAEKSDSAAKADDAARATTAAGLDRVIYKTVDGTVPAGTPDPADPGNIITATDAKGAFCDSGQRLVGGGVRVSNIDQMAVIDSFPEAGGTIWTARVSNDDTVPHGYTVYAICVPAAAAG